METNIHYTIVGAFVILLFSAFVLGVIWLSSGFGHQSFKTYQVYMQESVSGLNIDSPVEYNGVNVGSVTSVKLDARDPHFVDLELSIKTDTPISRGTTAMLSTRGVTGVTFIALKDTGTDLRPLEAINGQPYPVIKTSPSFFMRIDLVINSLANHIEKVSNAVQSLLDPENQQSIKVTLANMREISSTLAENNEHLNKIMANTARVTYNLTPLIESSRGAMVTLQNQTLPETYRLLANMNEVARNLAEVAKEIKQNPSVLIRGAQPRPPGPGEKR